MSHARAEVGTRGAVVWLGECTAATFDAFGRLADAEHLLGIGEMERAYDHARAWCCEYNAGGPRRERALRRIGR